MPTRPARRLSVLALIATSCLAWGAPLPDGLTTRQSLTSADASAVQAWAGDLLTSLRTGDPAQIAAARTELIDVLTRDVSVAFRLEASGALAGPIEQLVRANDEIRAFNGFQVAGVMATERAAEILRGALSAESPTVRYGGALGSRILFQQFAAGRSPLTQDAITQHMRALADALARETDPVVAEGLMTSFGVQFATPGVRAGALRLMNEAVVRRLDTLSRGADDDTAWTRPLVRAVDSSRRLLVDIAAANQRNAEFARASVALASRTLAFASRHLDADGARRDEIDNLLIASEFILLQTRDQLGGTGTAPNEQVRQAVERRNDDAIRRAIDAWIGDNGHLRRAPFNLPATSAGGR